MAEEIDLGRRMEVLRRCIQSLPAPEDEEQRQVIDGFNDLLSIMDDITTSLEGHDPSKVFKNTQSSGG